MFSAVVILRSHSSVTSKEHWSRESADCGFAKRKKGWHWAPAQLFSGRGYPDALSHRWRLLFLIFIWIVTDILTILQIASQNLGTYMLHLTELLDMVVASSCSEAWIFFSFIVLRRFLNFQSWVQSVLPAFCMLVFSVGVCDPISLCIEFEYLLVTACKHSYHFHIWNK